MSGSLLGMRGIRGGDESVRRLWEMVGVFGFWGFGGGVEDLGGF